MTEISDSDKHLYIGENDRRKEQRFPAAGICDVKLFQERDQKAATVIDVSRSGLQIEIGEPLNPGASVQIRFKDAVFVGGVKNLRPHDGGFRVGIHLPQDANSRVILDVARQKAERLADANEEQFRILFEEAPVAYHEIDTEGIVRRMNRIGCELLGFPASTVVGKAIWEFITPEQRESARESVSRKTSGEQPLAIFVREYLRKDGTRLFLEIHETLVRDHEGRIVGIRTAMIDIAERKRADIALRDANVKAERANRAKSRFLSNMSHEIRTPLTGILGMTDLALATGLTGEQTEYLSAIRGCALSLVQIFNDIMDFSDIDTGALHLSPVVFNLPDALAEIVLILSVPAAQKGLRLIHHIAAGTPALVLGDPARVRQVLWNVLGNSIKFTQKGEISLRVDLDAREGKDIRLRFSVIDTGIGIPEEKQAAVFEAFTQGDDSSTRRYGGTGLGLTISARLVKMMGGSMWLDSKPGVGTTCDFTMCFGAPIKAEAASSPVLAHK